jgi:hypothetical protein
MISTENIEPEQPVFNSIVFKGDQYLTSADYIEFPVGGNTQEIPEPGKGSFYAAAHYGQALLEVITWRNLLVLPGVPINETKVNISLMGTSQEGREINFFSKSVHNRYGPVKNRLFDKFVKYYLIQAENRAVNLSADQSNQN